MKRNFVWLDVTRLVLALMVVCIHIECALSPFIAWMLPVAVPGFFAISGFLMWHKESSSFHRAIVKIVKITVVSLLLYLPVYLFLDTNPDWRLASSWWNMLLFNLPIGMEHLWYLLAYLYVLLLMRVLQGFFENRSILTAVVAVLLLGANVALRYSGLEGYWWRNWLLTGLPYFLSGLVFRHLYELRGWTFLSSDHRLVKRLAQWGARYSLDIYIIHPLVFIGCGYTLCYFFAFRAAMWWLGPLVIFALSWLISVVRHLFFK